MSRLTRDSLAGGRNIMAGSSLLLQQQQRRIRGLAAGGGKTEEGGDEVLDLFSGTRRSMSVAAGEEPDGQNVPLNLGRISIGSAKLMRNGIDDLLSAADMGKHDYDWLLTPPGTPLVSTLDANDTRLPSLGPRANPLARSVSTTKASRFSAPQPENKHPTRPARSSSATRPSITTYSGQVCSNSSRTSVLNTSTASVTSFRPSTPGNSRSTSSSSNRPPAPAPSRATPSRSSTPAKTRPVPTSPGDKARPSHSSSSSRPSTPSPRSHTSATSNSNPPVTSVAGRPSSRPSTPTRRAPVQSSPPVAARSPSVGRSAAASGRNSAPASRPSSPGPRVRPPSQPLAPPDFPLDAPPNLKTKIPERPASAGRARPGLSLTARPNSSSEAAAPLSSNRRQSVSPVVTRGRLPENSTKMRLPSNGHEPGPPEIQRPMAREIGAQKPIKATVTTESTGFGRTISKKSLDMALRHMDIRQSMGGVRGASLFPQSIRSTAAKVTPARASEPRIPASIDGTDTADSSYSGTIYTGYDGAAHENGDVDLKSPERGVVGAGRASEPDVYESSRYESLLFKEDARSMNWLHSVEEKSDESPVFDLRFEPLPEPFVLL